jgi:stress-induced morphogen
MAIKKEKLEEIIKSSFPEATINIIDLAGDDDHFSLEIKSSKFNGLSRIKQHKMVYDALDGKMGGELHALSIKTISEE